MILHLLNWIPIHESIVWALCRYMIVQAQIKITAIIYVLCHWKLQGWFCNCQSVPVDARFGWILTFQPVIYCPASRTTLVATRFWVVMICPIIKCLTVLEFSFILFDLCLFITIFNFILNYVPIVTFWIFTYHKIWILLIIFCFIWSYWIIYFSTSLEVFWSVVS